MIDSQEFIPLIDNFLNHKDVQLCFNGKIVKGLEIITNDDYFYKHNNIKKIMVDLETKHIALVFTGQTNNIDLCYKDDSKLQNTIKNILNKINELSLDNTDYTIKHDKGKPQLALFPKEAMEAVCEIMEFGANKYGQGTWNRVEAIRYINAAARHLYAMQSKDENGKEYIDLSKKDNESGLEHLYHLACNVVYATALYKRDKEKCEK